MRSNKFHLGVGLILVLVFTVPLYLLLRGIGPFGQVRGIYQLPLAASAEATRIDTLFDAHFLLISFLFSLIVVLMLYAVVVFRRRPGDEGDGQFIHGSTSLEVAWTVAPLIAVVFFGAWGWSLLNDITAPAPEPLIVEVEGRQWAWNFAYPDAEGATSAELVLPVGRPVELHMESVDVLHSFWVPEFRVKQDLVPGRETVLRMTPSVEGQYKVRCAEICGLSHAYMLAPVRVVSQAVYEDYLEQISNLPETAEAWGQKHWQDYGCSGCHSLDGSDMVGPTWQGLYLREEQMEDGATIIADEAYITNSILNPNAQIVAGYPANIMPQNYGEQFARNQYQRDVIADLIAFIQTLDE